MSPIDCRPASPDRSVIRVAAEYRGVHVEFSVTDDGVGIPADHLPQQLRKFSRPTDKAGHQGLPVVQPYPPPPSQVPL